MDEFGMQKRLFWIGINRFWEEGSKIANVK